MGSLQLVGRVGDRLQTPLATLLVVPQPQSIGRPAGFEAGDTAFTSAAPKALPVTVTGTFKGASTPVNGIIVRYKIDSLVPATGSAILLNASGLIMRPDSTAAVDTTKNAGNATSTVVPLPGSGVAKVYVSASARRLDGPLLPAGGFVLVIKP